MQLVNIIIFLASTGISFRNVVCLFMGRYLSASVSEFYVQSERETCILTGSPFWDFAINRNSGPSPVSECGLAWRHWLSMHLMKSTFARERTCPAAPALDCIWSLSAWGNSHVVFLSIVLVLSFVKHCNNALSWRHISSNDTAESSLWH